MGDYFIALLSYIKIMLWQKKRLKVVIYRIFYNLILP